MTLSSIISATGLGLNLWDRGTRFFKRKSEPQPCFSISEKRVPNPPGIHTFNPPHAFLRNTGPDVARNVTWTYITRNTQPKIGKPEPLGNIGIGEDTPICMRGFKVRPVPFKWVGGHGGLHLQYEDQTGKPHECRLMPTREGAFRMEEVVRPRA